MIKTVVFDIGKVVWDYERSLSDIHHRWSRLLDLPLEDFLSKYVMVYQHFEINTLDIDSWLLSLSPSIDLSLFHQAIGDVFDNKPDFDSYYDLPVVDLLHRLKQRYPVGCLTNAENYCYPYFKKFGLYSHFDYSIISWQVGIRKPDPCIYQLIFKHIDCLPSEVIFIDDKPENIAAAQKLGINGILFQNSNQLISDILPLLSSH